jgi:hypothetical protein
MASSTRAVSSGSEFSAGSALTSGARDAEVEDEDRLRPEIGIDDGLRSSRTAA